MIKLIKHTAIFIISIFVTAAFSGDTINSFFKTDLPRIELETNTGYILMLQIKGNININDISYVNFRTSGTYGFSELGIIIGLQHQFSKKGRLQFGLGYTYVVKDTTVISLFLPGVSPVKWNGVSAEVNLMHYFIKDVVSFGIDIGVNCTFSVSSATGVQYSSINVGFVLGFL
jgi:hypothetical protein